ncbi:MAG: transglutaminase family protein [Vicingaceae bacterium]|nr:transglutaminase family protein [Vicingaceae bacterium]
MKNIFLTLTLLLPLISSSQNFTDEINNLLEKYSSENKISLSVSEDINISLSKTNEIVITSNFREEKFYLHNNANIFSEESVDGSFFHEISDLKASSFVLEKNKYKEYKVTDIKEKDKFSSSIFHDDTKEYSFYFPNLTKGSKSILSYKTTIKNPRFLYALFFQNYYPINNLSLTITVDDNIELDFKYFNTSEENLNYQKKTKKNKTTHSWKLNEIPKSKSENSAPSFYYTIPHVVPYIKSYTVNDSIIPLLESTANLYNWYYSLSKEIYENNDTVPELIELVDSLTKNCTSDIEKLKTIYYWAQENIKYIAFESGLGGFVPREASVVFKNRFGDCKDNSSILLEMLRYAGLNTYLTWVGTRRLPYKYTDLPSPKVDNHMINTCIIDSNFYYLDATGRYSKLGLVPAFIQEKEVLIGIDSTNFIIKKLPQTHANKNYSYDSLQVEINALTLSGICNHYLDGYTKIRLFNALESINKREDLKKYYMSYAKKGNNKFIIIDFEEKNKFSYDSPFVLSYQFNIDNYVSTSNNHLYINLTLHKDNLPEKIKKDRELPIEIEYGFTKNYYYKLKIPTNYEVEFLPKNLTFNENGLTYQINYSIKDNYIIYQASFQCNKLIIKPEEFNIWNTFAQNLQNASKELIVFKQK